jgi:hypothetical protein
MKLDVRREGVSEVVQTLLAGLSSGGGMQGLQRVQTEIQPAIGLANADVRGAVNMVERELTAEQWQLLPERIRTAGQAAAGPGRSLGGFNALALLDQQLANPIPVLLELKERLELTPDQLQQVEAVSASLQERLNRRRADLGKRFDNAQGVQQMQIFAQIQPDIEAGRREIREALQAVQRILTPAQWGQVPEVIRDPFTVVPQIPGLPGRGG